MMKNKTIAKICGLLSVVPIILFITDDTNSPWIMMIFFVFLAFMGLFNALGEKDEEIEELRLPKDSKEEKEKRWREQLEKLAKIDPRSNDPFYLSDSEEKTRLLKEIVGRKDKSKKETYEK